MSVKIMSAVWEGYPGGGSDLLALLALADWADDDGRCWPSIANIASKCRLSRSQSQRVVHRLMADGHLILEGNATGGPPGATRRYRIAVESLTGRIHATGSADATGRTHAQDGSHPCANTGSAHATQPISEPSVNRQQVNNTRTRTTKSKGSAKAKTKFDALQFFADKGIDQQIVDDFVTLRKAKRAPITATVAADLESEAAKAGVTLTEALRICCKRNWQGFQAEWLANSGKSHQAAKRTPTPENFAGRDYGQSGAL